MVKQVGISAARVLTGRAVKRKAREVFAWGRAVRASQDVGKCGFIMLAGIRGGCLEVHVWQHPSACSRGRGGGHWGDG